MIRSATFVFILLSLVLLAGKESTFAGNTINVVRGQQPIYIGWGVWGATSCVPTATPASGALGDWWMQRTGGIGSNYPLPKPTSVGTFNFICTHQGSGASDLATLVVSDCASPLVWNPTTEQCSTPVNNPPIGDVNSVDCGTMNIVGWTCDPDAYSQALPVHVYRDGPYNAGPPPIAVGTANTWREEGVGAMCGGYRAHGFSISLPPELRDGNNHDYYAYAIDSNGVGPNPLLTGTYKSKNCPVPVVDGCGTANGRDTLTRPSSNPSSNLCSGGSPSWSDDTANDNEYNWSCGTAQCKAAKMVPGICGTAAKPNYASTDTSFSGTICAQGNPSPYPTFPTQGNSVSWTCSGTNSGASSPLCTATRAAVVGQCGTAHLTARNSYFDLTGQYEKCLLGTPQSNDSIWPMTTGHYYGFQWKCMGSDDASSADDSGWCQVYKPPVCGSANNVLTLNQPADVSPSSMQVLCGIGQPYDMAPFGTLTSSGWEWKCANSMSPLGTPVCRATIFQCSDNRDNDTDGLIDRADPGCHYDNNPTNPNSYVPTDNDETNSNPPPGDPQNFQANAAVGAGSCGGQITLSWTAATGADYYEVSTNGRIPPWIVVSGGNAARNYTFTAPSPSNIYGGLYVRAVKGSGASIVYSTEVGPLSARSSDACPPVTYSCSGSIPTGYEAWDTEESTSLGGPATWAYSATDNPSTKCEYRPTVCPATTSNNCTLSQTNAGTIVNGTCSTSGTCRFTCQSDGTWREDLACNPPVTKPNLNSVSAPQRVSGTLTQGTDVTFRGTVKNNGTINISTAFSDNFSYRWGTSGGWTEFSSHTQPSMNVNDARNDTSQSFSLANSGILQIQHCVDSSMVNSYGQIDESDESVADNCKIQQFTVTAAPTSYACTGSIPTGYEAYDAEESTGLGGLATWTYSATDNPNVKCEYRHTVCPATTSNNCTLSQTNAGNSTTGTCSTSGTCTYTCQNDGTWREDVACVPPNTKPNLTSDGAPWIVSGTLVKGTNVTFRGAVWNNGTTNISTPFSDNFTYRWGTSGAWVEISSHTHPSLWAQQARNDTSQSFSLANSGTLQIQHCVDSWMVYSYGQIEESDESVADNCKVKTFTVTDAPTYICLLPAGKTTIPTNTTYYYEDDVFINGIVTAKHNTTNTSEKCEFYCPAPFEWDQGSWTCSMPSTTGPRCSTTQKHVCDAGTPSITSTGAQGEMNYTWSCTMPTFAAATCSMPTPPTIDLQADNLTPVGTTNLTWVSYKNPQNCKLYLENPTGSGSSLLAPVPNASVNPTTTIPITQATTYKIICDGGVEDSVELKPGVRSYLSANPVSQNIYEGGTFTLTLDAHYADVCTFNVKRDGVSMFLPQGNNMDAAVSSFGGWTRTIVSPTRKRYTFTSGAFPYGLNFLQGQSTRFVWGIDCTGVNGGSAASDPATISMTINKGPGVVKRQPALSAGPDQTLPAGQTFTTLEGTLTDPDGWVTFMSWLRTDPVSGVTLSSSGMIENPSQLDSRLIGINPSNGIEDLALAAQNEFGEWISDTVRISTSGANKPNLAANAINVSSGPYNPGDTVSLTGIGAVRAIGTSRPFSDNLTYELNGDGNWQPIQEFRQTQTYSIGATFTDGPVSYRLPNQNGMIRFQYCVDSRMVNSYGEIDEADETVGDNCEPTGRLTIGTGNPPSGPSCTGAQPANTAAMCLNDDIGLSRDVAKTAVAYGGCTVARKCEYPCTRGYAKVGNVCLPADITFKICDEDGVSNCILSGNTKNVDAGAKMKVIWSSTHADFCTEVSGNEFNTGGRPNGDDDPRALATPGIDQNYSITCGNDGEDSGTPKTVTVHTNGTGPILLIDDRVVSSRDREYISPDSLDDRRVKVSWDTNNGNEGLCTLTRSGSATNLMVVDGADGNENGSLLSQPPINARTTFTLKCGVLPAVSKTVEWQATIQET